MLINIKIKHTNNTNTFTTVTARDESEFARIVAEIERRPDVRGWARESTVHFVGR